jgi:hypothetical protein
MRLTAPMPWGGIVFMMNTRRDYISPTFLDVYRQTPYRVRQQLHRHVQRVPGGLVFQTHRHLYHSTLGFRVIKKREKKKTGFC